MSIQITNGLPSKIYFILPANQYDNFVFIVIFIHNRHFFPFGRRPNLPADLTTKPSL